eukprot:7607290-Pyramimonas_sp.AAC.1
MHTATLDVHCMLTWLQGKDYRCDGGYLWQRGGLWKRWRMKPTSGAKDGNKSLRVHSAPTAR